MLRLLYLFSLVFHVHATPERTTFLQSIRLYACENYLQTFAQLFTCDTYDGNNKIKKQDSASKKDSRDAKTVYCTSEINKTNSNDIRCQKFNNTHENKSP